VDGNGTLGVHYTIPSYILPNFYAFCKAKSKKFTNFWNFFGHFSAYWMKARVGQACTKVVSPPLQSLLTPGRSDSRIARENSLRLFCGVHRRKSTSLRREAILYPT